MSTMIRLRGLTVHKKIFIWYNFKQVRDAVLSLFFAEKTNAQEKVFIYKSADGWETDMLRSYTDDKTYDAICSRLRKLFRSDEDDPGWEAPGTERSIEQYSDFIGVN